MAVTKSQLTSRQVAARRAARTRKANEKLRGIGVCSVYVCHAVNFGGTLRPAYDSAPQARAELTLKQADQLRHLINRFMAKCIEANAATA